MIFDFSFQQVMRLSSIKRWGIIEMARPQSVAEHSYNVTMIALYFVDRIPNNHKPAQLREIVLNYALAHDLPELVTGDMPTPIKQLIKHSLDDAERDLFPILTSYKEALSPLAKVICKMADLIEAIQFARKFCVDSRKEEIIDEMLDKIWEIPELDKISIQQYNAIEATVEALWNDEKTL